MKSSVYLNVCWYCHGCYDTRQVSSQLSPLMYISFHNIHQKAQEVNLSMKTLKGSLFNCFLLLINTCNSILIFVKLRRVHTSTANYPDCIWSTLPCCLVTWKWLNNSGAVVTSAVFPPLFTSWVEGTPRTDWAAPDGAFLVNLIVFLCPVIPTNYSVSRGLFLVTLTGGRDSLAELKSSHQNTQAQNHLAGLLTHSELDPSPRVSDSGGLG